MEKKGIIKDAIASDRVKSIKLKGEKVKIKFKDKKKELAEKCADKK